MESISVVIPCYKQAHFLGEAIESVIAQTYPSHEIVVVDDGSPDHTAEIAKQYPAVRYIRQENQGLGAARNKGLQESTGNYLVFLDADDRLLPNHFQRSLRAFQEREDAAVVCGLFRAFGDTEWVTAHQCDPKDSYGTVLRFPSIAMVLTAMFKRDIVTRLGGFSLDTNVAACEDFEFLLRLTQRDPLYCHHELVAEYRLHQIQTTRNRAALLRASMTVYRSQRNYIRVNPRYKEDYVKSRSYFQRFWGDATASDMVAAARSGRVGQAMYHLWALLRFYPTGLLNLVRQKFFHILSNGQNKPDPSS